MSQNLFITGTGTDVGKTFVSALMVKKLVQSNCRAGYFKAAMSGNRRRADGRLIPGDGAWVQQISGISQPLEEMCPYVYENAWSPHLASRVEGNPVQLEEVQRRFVQVCGRYDYVTIEGSGGILCPIRFDQEKIWMEDVIQALGLSCLLVADAGLGTINSVGLTAEYIRSRGIPVKGIIFNRFHPGDGMEEDNRLMCEALTGLKVLACVKVGDDQLDLDAQALAALYE